MKKYADLFIDFDDTIYDTRGNAELALAELYEARQWSRYFDRPEDFTVPYWKTNAELWEAYSLGKIPRDYLIVERFRRPLSLGRGLHPDKAYCLEVSDEFLGLCNLKSALVPGARELLDYFSAKGYPMHICSNGFHETQQRKAEVSGTAHYFKSMILSEDAGHNKPSEAFYRYALRMTGAQPETTLMIGDNLLTDMSGARAVGIDTLYFNRWHTDDHEEVTYRVDRLTDIITLFEQD